MRVLDVGCGPGDVSFLCSELVGGGGSVVGVERDEQAFTRARRRAVESEHDNVELVLGDSPNPDLDSEVAIDTLADRLRADTGVVGRVTFWPTVVGAFARKP